MTEEQRKHLERRLLEERSRVVGALDQYRARKRDTSSDAAGDVSHYPFHLADEGTDTMDSELDASEAARETRLLVQDVKTLVPSKEDAEEISETLDRAGICRLFQENRNMQRGLSREQHCRSAGERAVEDCQIAFARRLRHFHRGVGEAQVFASKLSPPKLAP